MAKPSEKFLFTYEEPTAVVVAGIQGRAPLATLQGAVAVFDDYTKRNRKGLTKAIGERFRVGAHLFGDLTGAEVSFIVGVPVAAAKAGAPIQLNSAQVREGLTVIGRRWLSLDAFGSGGLEVEEDFQGWLIAAGPKATARIAIGSADGKKSAATATAKKAGAFDAQKHSYDSYFLVATAK
jgi:hypothetical protein